MHAWCTYWFLPTTRQVPGSNPQPYRRTFFCFFLFSSSLLSSFRGFFFFFFFFSTPSPHHPGRIVTWSWGNWCKRKNPGDLHKFYGPLLPWKIYNNPIRIFFKLKFNQKKWGDFFPSPFPLPPIKKLKGPYFYITAPHSPLKVFVNDLLLQAVSCPFQWDQPICSSALPSQTHPWFATGSPNEMHLWLPALQCPHQPEKITRIPGIICKDCGNSQKLFWNKAYFIPNQLLG